ncbi:hypothetical protein LEMLEM_LOCUS10458 [Lemmus lemmus]
MEENIALFNGEGPGCLKILELAQVSFQASLTPIFAEAQHAGKLSPSLINCSCPPPQWFAQAGVSTSAVVQLQRSRENPKEREAEDPKAHITKLPLDKTTLELEPR